MLLSIITINFNDKEGLYKTVKSVAEQTSSNYEHIIIDGGSTDGSVEVLKDFLKNESYSSHVTYWCSEKDKGIYNAMNKGISHINGDYVLMLNSGDYFIDSTIVEKINSLSFNEDIVYFDALFQLEKGTKIAHYPDEITATFFSGKRALCHQNTLIKTDLQKRRLYDESFKIAGDLDFFFDTLIIQNCSAKHFDFPLVCYDACKGISSKKDNFELRDCETAKSIKSYLSPRLLASFYDAIRMEDELDEYKYKWKGILYKLKKIFEKYSSFKNHLK